MYARAWASWEKALGRPWPALVLLTAFAFAIRLYRLAGPVLRWDEGWSLAHASLPWAQLLAIARHEWHPPLYIALLKLWLITGKTAWGMRFFSVLLSTLAVPLGYQVARAWSGRERVALLGAGAVAVWPLLVYYGQVARMYALSELAVLAAAWFLLRRERAASRWNDLGFVLSAAMALYALYYTAFVLAGIWLYAWAAGARRPRRLIWLGVAAAACYGPWLLLAWPTIRSRLNVDTGVTGNPLVGTAQFLIPTLRGLVFDMVPERRPGLVVGIVLLGAALAARPTRSEARQLLLPLFTIALGVLSIAYGAQAARWFAVRHLVPTAPFLGLALAWALDRLAGWRGWAPLTAALLALGIAYWPLSARVVYEKNLEVVDPFDPGADHRYLAARSTPDDLVYFNVLARAGWYENLRSPADPPWTYAMRWDPIIEPMEQIIPRIWRDAASHRALWFVLYKGNYGPNAPLVGWLDANLYPAAGNWQEDMLYMAYIVPRGAWRCVRPEGRWANGIYLESACWTPEAPPGRACAVELTWRTASPINADLKVFVHALDAAGRLVAQHDGVPGMGLRPVNAWPLETPVLDRHGLLLSVGPGELRLLVGFYDSHTGQRVHLEDGRDAIALGTCAIVKP